MRDEIKQWVKAWGIVPSSAGGWLACAVYTPWGVLDMSAAWSGRNEACDDFPFPPSSAVPGLGFVSWAEKSEHAYDEAVAKVLEEETKEARLERAARKRELVLNAQLRDAGIEGQAVWLKPGDDAPVCPPPTAELQAWLDEQMRNFHEASRRNLAAQGIPELEPEAADRVRVLWDKVRAAQELASCVVPADWDSSTCVDALGGPDCGLCAAEKLCPFCERQA